MGSPQRRANKMPSNGNGKERPGDKSRHQLKKQLTAMVDAAIDDDGFRGLARVAEALAAGLHRANAGLTDYMPGDGPPGETEEFREVLDGIITDVKQTADNLHAFTDDLDSLIDDDPWQQPE